MTVISKLPISILAWAISLLVPLALRADVTITATEDGNDVLFAWSGSLTPGTHAATATNTPQRQVWPSQGGIGAWQANAASYEYTLDAAVPFGQGGNSVTALLSGVSEGTNFFLLGSSLWLNQDYVDGTPFTTTLRVPGETFASLMIDSASGPYVWTIAGTSETVTLEFVDQPTVSPPPGPTVATAKLKRKVKKLKQKLRKAKKRASREKLKRLRKQLAKATRALRAIS